MHREDHTNGRAPHKAAATAKKGRDAHPVAKKLVEKTAAQTEGEGGARIVVLTDDPHRNVVIMPGCRVDSMRQEKNAYFFEHGNELVGMIVEGGTVEYHAADRTYVVRLTNSPRRPTSRH